MSGFVVYTAAEAAEVAKTPRQRIDAACKSGALVAIDERPESSRRSWRIAESDLADWHRRGRPLIKAPDDSRRSA